jgi:hypothetical protein
MKGDEEPEMMMAIMIFVIGIAMVVFIIFTNFTDYTASIRTDQSELKASYEIHRIAACLQGKIDLSASGLKKTEAEIGNCKGDYEVCVSDVVSGVQTSACSGKQAWDRKIYITAQYSGFVNMISVSIKPKPIITEKIVTTMGQMPNNPSP